MNLVLASTSAYRRLLLQRLGLAFTIQAPGVEESRLDGEPPCALAHRLACAKAQAIADAHPSALVIGSDQVASLGDQVLGKPGTVANAQRQLAACSGAAVEFYTAVAVCHGERRRLSTHVDRTTVCFRVLTEHEIRHYVARDKPLDCAGAFKAEGLGITLFSSVRSEDPTALIGLPLIKLCALLREFGIDPTDC